MATIKTRTFSMSRRILACISILLLFSSCGDDTTPGNGNGNGNGSEETYAVSGNVTTSGGSGLQGVEISFSGGTATLASVTTDADGAWQQSGLKGSVTVTPAHDDYRFDPVSTTVDSARTNVDFSAIATYTVAGLIVDDDDDPIPGVEVQFAGENSPDSVHTDENGRWEGKHLDGEVTVTPVDPAYTFDNETRTVQAAASDIDFVGTMKECNAGDKSDPSDPCVITRIKQVQNIQTTLDGHYALGADVDAYATEAWENGAGFEPLGSQNTTQFTGTFNGQEFEIQGLFIDRETTNEVGMFGYVGVGGEISDLTLVDSKVQGGNYVGAVAGVSRGAITGVHSDTQVTGSERVGGIVGSNYATVIAVSNAGDIVGEYRVGGIAGANTGEITLSLNEGAVQGDEQVGGIAGYSLDGTISQVTNAGNTTGEDEHTGGIVGLTEHSTLNDVQNQGDIQGVFNVGGIAGENRRDSAQPQKVSLITDAHNTGTIVGQDYVGGIAGFSHFGHIEHTHNHDSATVDGENYVGGVVGRLSSGHVQTSHNGGDITSTSLSAGGIVGYNYHGVIDRTSNVGGIKGDIGVGGIAGELSQSGARASASFNLGNVEGSLNVGGVAGTSYLGTIEDSYNLGNVASPSGRAGGVIGLSSGAGGVVRRTFSAGTVQAADKGGVVAQDSVNAVSDSHFDKDVAPGMDDEATWGRTSAEMMQEGTYTNWDFTTVWIIDEGNDYPQLRENQR